MAWDLHNGSLAESPARGRYSVCAQWVEVTRGSAEGQNTQHIHLSSCQMGTPQAFLQGPLFGPPAHVVPGNVRLFHHSSVITAFAISQCISASADVCVCSSQLNCGPLGDRNSVLRSLSTPGLARAWHRVRRQTRMPWQPQRCTAQLPLQERLMQEHASLSASRSRPFGATMLSQQGHTFHSCSWSMAAPDGDIRANPLLPHVALLHQPSTSILGAALRSEALPSLLLSRGSDLCQGPRPAYGCPLPIALQKHVPQ